MKKRPQPTYARDERGKCPHCGHLVVFTALSSEPNLQHGRLTLTGPTKWDEDRRPHQSEQRLTFSQCPGCLKPIVELDWGVVVERNDYVHGGRNLLVPAAGTRPVPDGVPAPVTKDFREACQTLGVSPNASAALSRRCLQSLLKDRGYTQRDLVDQVEAAKSSLPAHLQNIDHVREIGNFAAHPNKDTATGEIIEVEPEDAEWLLDLLEHCFTHFYVDPVLQAERERKLAEMKARRRPQTQQPTSGS